MWDAAEQCIRIMRGMCLGYSHPRPFELRGLLSCGACVSYRPSISRAAGTRSTFTRHCTTRKHLAKRYCSRMVSVLFLPVRLCHCHSRLGLLSHWLSASPGPLCAESCHSGTTPPGTADWRCATDTVNENNHARWRLIHCARWSMDVEVSSICSMC